MIFLNAHTNLNVVTFNEDTQHHVLHEFEPFSGYMKCFATHIRGFKFLNIYMIRDQQGRDLEEALTYQKQFSDAMIYALESRFGNNDIVNAFNVLILSNMP